MPDELAKYIDHFNERYGQFGGVEKLIQLHFQGLSVPKIAKHFEMSPQYTATALKRILGKDYHAFPFNKPII